MEPSDVERVGEIYRAWNQTTADEWVERHFAPDGEWHDAPELPDSGLHRGVVEIQAMFRGIAEVGGHFDVHVTELHDAGDQCVVVFRMVGRGGHSGVPMELLVSHAVTLRDGRISRVLGFIDRDSGFRAAGIKP
jgi:ketosteroid isomerase-like protein